MLGYAEMAEAVVWLQTHSSAKVYAIYYKAEEKDQIFSTDTVFTVEKNANTAKLIFDQVKAGSLYHYYFNINGVNVNKDEPYQFTTQPDWAYKTDPPNFSFAMGSCVYVNESAYDRPGRPYGGDYHIFQSILAKDPDMMLWLGDNTYLRPADFTSRTGYLHRYSHTRAVPEMQELLSSCNNYAIWDDHEFGPNDASGSWIHKDVALEVFKLFWANPSYGYKDLPGIMSAFTYMDVQFILMDNRYNRTADFKAGEKHIFGKKQCDYLIDMLKMSRASFKFVATGGQLLNTAQVYENHSNFEEERAYILKRIEEEEIKGVIFLTGDRHHSEVMELEFKNGSKVYEFTTSPLTSSAGGSAEEPNDNRVKGSFIRERNFSTVEVSGKFGERKLILRYYNSDGKEIYKYEI